MKYDRQSQIKQLFQEKKRVTIKELCDTFGISVETARRDLNELERDGTIRRIYGGAVLQDNSEGLDFMPPWDTRFTQNLAEKKAIAQELLTRIPDNSIIALDSGTTIFELAKLLGAKKGLTILTNDLRMALEVSANTSHMLYYIGGAVKKDDMITTGFLANDFLKHFSHIDVTVLSADGFNGNIGLTDYNVEMGTLKEAMVQKSSQVFVGADHSKFLTSGFYKVCGIHDLSLVVTDVGASQASLEALREAGVEVVVVDP